MATDTKKSSPQIRVLAVYLVHVAIGSLIFVALYVPTVGLHLSARWLRTREVGYLPIVILEVGEYSLILANSVLLIVFLAKTAWRTSKRL